MGKRFLERASLEEERSESAALEEQYEKLFPKIGRDFVYRDDLARVVDAIMAIVDPAGITPIDFLDTIEAKRRALEYKAVLESGKDGTKLFKDLINLDD